MQHRVNASLVAKTFRLDGTEAPVEDVLREFYEALDGLEFEVETDGEPISYQIRVEEFSSVDTSDQSLQESIRESIRKITED